MAGQRHLATLWQKSSKLLTETLGVEVSSWWQMVDESIIIKYN